MKKELIIAILAVGLTIGMASMATAETLEQETEVDVEISGVTQLDVRPSSLAYTEGEDGTGLSPGADVQVSDEGYEHIEVENIGSEKIGSIYAQATMHNTQPFGQYSANEGDFPHNTGNFVTISTETASDYGIGGLNSVDNMHHLNRVEYGEDNAPTYLTTEETDFDSQDPDSNRESVDIDEVQEGRLRVGGAEYFYVVYIPESADPELRVGNTPHTSTILGTADFTDEAEDYTAYDLEGNDDVGATDVFQAQGQELVSFDTSSEGEYDGETLIDDGDAIDGNLPSSAEVKGYNLYADIDGNFVLRTKFNVEQQSPDGEYQLNDEGGSGSQEYILQTSNEADALQPGENFPVDFGVQIPLGVDQSDIEEGTVTIISETF